MAKRLGVVVVLAALGLAWRAPGADAPAASEERLRKDLRFLASDECEGRGITTKGINLAADYVKHGFQQAGLKPGGPDGSYFQPFTLTTGVRSGPNNRLVLRGPQGQAVTLEADRQFSVALQGGNGKADAPVVFAGYGITSTDPAYDDYADLDVEGKVVLVLTGTPRAGHPFADDFATADGNRAEPHRDLRTKVLNALKHKAAAVLVVNDRTSASRFGDTLPRPRVGRASSVEPARIPVFHVRRDLADRLLVSAGGRSLADVEKEIDRGLKPAGVAVGWSCRAEADLTRSTVQVKNVLGVLEGAGPLARETVVIGAHYDHIGFGAGGRFAEGGRGVSPPGSPGGAGFPLAEMGKSSIHYGADDNASGTAAIMELARRFAAQKGRQGRRLVFMAFSAEESGLLGSAYYCRHPVFPLESTVAMVNLDMVGRLQDGKLLAGGLGSAKELTSLVEKHNARHQFKLEKSDAGAGPSDHSSFFSRGVPVVFLFTGFHEQYHRPTDRLETINVEGVRRVTDITEDLVAELARQAERPTFVRTRARFDRSTVLWAGSPSVGIIPAAKGEGVLVDDVVRGTAAEKAGVKKGDRVVAVAGEAVKDLPAYLARARTLKSGTKVELTLERGGKQQKVQLELTRPARRFTVQRLGVELAFGGDPGEGIRLAGVREGGPAAKAGLKAGDRIVAMAGADVAGVREFSTAARELAVGKKVEVTVVRDGKRQTFEVTPE